MSVSERIRLIRMIEMMRTYPEYSARLGLKEKNSSEDGEEPSSLSYKVI